MRLVDSHIHLDFDVFDVDRDALLRDAVGAGIEHFVVPATTRQSWGKIRYLAESNKHISVAYGIHPYFIQGHTLADIDALDHWLEENTAVAVGEIGLDYFLPDLDRQQQITLFEAQLLIASNRHLPVILHARKAIDDVIRCIRKFDLNGGIVHSFNGSNEQALRLIGLGFKLGFGGALTYPRASRLRKLIQTLPLEALCLETDAPDQPSAEFHGKRNEPIALLEVLETIAVLRKQSAQIIATQSTENTYLALNIC